MPYSNSHEWRRSMSEPEEVKWVGKSSVLMLGGSVLVVSRKTGKGKQERKELVAIEVQGLEVIGTYTDKEALQEMLEEREWSEKVAARKAGRKSLSEMLDEPDEDEQGPDLTGIQQPPV